MTSDDKRRLWYLLLLFCAAAVLIAIADRAPVHLEGRFPSVTLRNDVTSYLDGVIHQTSPGPYVYRVLVPYTIAAIRALVPAFTPLDIDLFLKIGVLVLCQFSFYIYLRRFFPSFVALAGVFLLDALLPFTLSSIQGPSIIETSDLLNLCIFSMAFTALHADRFGVFCLLLFAGTLNRETTWLILPALFLVDVMSRKPLYRPVAATAAVAVPYVGLRLIIRTEVPRWVTSEGVVRNIPFLADDQLSHALAANLHVAVLLGPLLILGLIGFRKHSLFLRVATVVTPFFLVVHYLFGWVIEARLWMPLFIIFIPLALETLVATFGEKSPTPGSGAA